MNINKKALAASLASGVLLALLSAVSLFGRAMDSPNPSLITKIFLWNIVLAIKLMELGALPACANGEMAILLYVMFNGFIVGLIGYSVAFYCGIWLINRIKK